MGLGCSARWCLDRRLGRGGYSRFDIMCRGVDSCVNYNINSRKDKSDVKGNFSAKCIYTVHPLFTTGTFV